MATSTTALSKRSSTSGLRTQDHPADVLTAESTIYVADAVPAACHTHPCLSGEKMGEDREGESGLSMKRKGRERKSSGRREEAIRSDAIPTKMRILGALVPIRTSPIITKYGT